MRSLGLLVLLSIPVLAGCGGSAAKRPADVYPVTGKVIYKDKPLVGADVTFFNEEKNRSAFGRTNDQGVYKLTTFSSNDGAVEGKQIVTIVKIEAPPAPAKVVDVDSADYQPPGFNQSDAPPPPKSSFPAKYGDRNTSGLVAVVNADGANVIDFDLKD